MTKKFINAAIALATLAGALLATARAANAAVVTHIGYGNTAAPVAVRFPGRELWL